MKADPSMVHYKTLNLSEPLESVCNIIKQLVKTNSIEELQTVLLGSTRQYSSEMFLCLFVDNKEERVLNEVDINFSKTEKISFTRDVLNLSSNKSIDDSNYEELFSTPDFFSTSYGLSLYYNRSTCFVKAPRTIEKDRLNSHIIRTIVPYIHLAFNHIQHIERRSCGEVGLTKRETQIIGWVAKGKTNKEIGMILDLSEFTVKNHIANIYSKLIVVNRAQAIEKAIRLEFLI